MDVRKYKRDELLNVAENLTAENIKELVGYLWEKMIKLDIHLS